MITQWAWGAMLAGVLAAGAWGQAAHPRPGVAHAAKTYAVTGVVLNEVTGDPVPRATVELLDEILRDTVIATETGEDGRFTLPGMPAGKYGLRVARRGYITSFFNEHEEFSSAIVTGEGQDTEHIEFKLKPTAMVRGMVTDDAGEPVAQAQVVLVRKSRSTGLGEVLTRSISGPTDDRGIFEFWNLIPGTYLLAVKATPWFALHPHQNNNDAAATSSSLDVAYPVTYYDGTTDETAATAIAVTPGDRTEVDVSLHAVPALRLSVRTSQTQTPGGRGYYNMPMLRQRVFGEDEMVPTPASLRPGSDTAELTGVAPGHYTVAEGNPPKLTEVDAAGTGGVSVDPAAATQTTTIRVQTRSADGTPLPSPLNLVLMPEEGARNEIGAEVDSGFNKFTGLKAGTYTMLARTNNAVLAVVSLQAGTETLAGSRFAVGEKPLTLTALVAQGTTRVRGLARKDGKALAGVMIVLVPRDPGANWAMFRRDQSDSDGTFALRDVVPGQYTVVAIEEGWGLDWARPEVITRYLPRGQAVTLTSQSGKTVNLPAPVEVQPR